MNPPHEPTAATGRVRWLDSPEATTSSCFLCGNGVDNSIILRAQDSRSSETLEVASCGRCGSAWFPDLARHLLAYPHEGDIGDPSEFTLLIDHYFDLVGGLDWKAQLVERVRPNGPSAVLEVGCGAGLLLDYLREMWGADVQGLEPSAYGEAGATRLSLTIEPTTLKSATDVQGRRFDRIVSTEVIEHVPDPQAFLNSLAEVLADDGVLVLTTPRASSLVATTPFGELYDALSVGAHYFLASPSQLESMALTAGFEHVHMEEPGMANVLFASKSPLCIAPPGNPEALAGAYYDAAAARSDTGERTQLSDSMNAYVYQRAAGRGDVGDLRSKADALLLECFGIAVHRISEIANPIERSRSIFELGEVAPYNLGAYLFWRGQSDDLTENERTTVWEVGGLYAATGLRVDPVNMSMGAPTLHRLAAALDGRVPSPVGKQLRMQMSAVPEVSQITIGDPDWRTQARSQVRSVKHRLMRQRSPAPQKT